MERNFPTGKKFYFAVPETVLIYIELVAAQHCEYINATC